MQHILLVLDGGAHIKPMLVKALKFLPQEISILLFTGADQASQSALLQAKVDALVSNQCNSSLIVAATDSSAQKEQKLRDTLADNSIDMTILHRPRLGQANMDFSLIKTVLRVAVNSAVLLSGDNRWRLPVKLLGTLDIFEQNPAQQTLNQKVLNVLGELMNKFEAELNVLSVIPISRIKTEFDITNEDEVLAKKEQAAKTKLKSILHTTQTCADAAVFIAAGSPAMKIASVASKQKASLVVMGNVGRTGITGLLIGNTAEKILGQIGVDVLIIRQ